MIVLQELIAKEPARDHEPVVKPVHARDAEAPVDVISLEFIRHTLDVEDELILLEPIRPQVVNQWKIRIRSARSACGRAYVPRETFPAINLDAPFLPRFPLPSTPHPFHPPPPPPAPCTTTPPPPPTPPLRPS